jgi:hypothetical protein
MRSGARGIKPFVPDFEASLPATRGADLALLREDGAVGGTQLDSAFVGVGTKGVFRSDGRDGLGWFAVAIHRADSSGGWQSRNAEGSMERHCTTLVQGAPVGVLPGPPIAVVATSFSHNSLSSMSRCRLAQPLPHGRPTLAQRQIWATY